MSLDNPDGGEPPKVDTILAEAPAPRETARAMLGRFLVREQEERQKLRDDFQLGTTWKDLANAYNSINQTLMMSPRNLDVDASKSFQVTNLDDPSGPSAPMILNLDMYDTFTGESSASKRASFAASKAAEDDKAEQRRIKKEAKKERKRARKEQKKTAKKQAKMYIGSPF